MSLDQGNETCISMRLQICIWSEQETKCPIKSPQFEIVFVDQVNESALEDNLQKFVMLVEVKSSSVAHLKVWVVWLYG